MRFSDYLRLLEHGYGQMLKKRTQSYTVRRTPRTKRSVRILISLLLLHRLIYPQKISYERNYKTGSHPQIPPQITILHASPTTKERHPGSSKVVFSSSGSRLLLFCGSMENVRPFSSSLFDTPLTPIFIAGSGKSVLWFVFPVIVAYFHSEYFPALG